MVRGSNRLTLLKGSNASGTSSIPAFLFPESRKMFGMMSLRNWNPRSSAAPFSFAGLRFSSRLSWLVVESEWFVATVVWLEKGFERVARATDQDPKLG